MQIYQEYAKLSGMSVDELKDHPRVNTEHEWRWDLRLGNREVNVIIKEDHAVQVKSVKKMNGLIVGDLSACVMQQGFHTQDVTRLTKKKNRIN